MIRHDFLVLYFCVIDHSQRIFNTLEEIFARKMFSFNNFFCGNLFLRIAGKIAKIVKMEPAKIRATRYL